MPIIEGRRVEGRMLRPAPESPRETVEDLALTPGWFGDDGAADWYLSSSLVIAGFSFEADGLVALLPVALRGTGQIQKVTVKIQYGALAEGAGCALRLRYLGPDDSSHEMESTPLYPGMGYGVFEFSLPLGHLTPSRLFSCSLGVTLMPRGSPILIRGVWLHAEYKE